MSRYLIFSLSVVFLLSCIGCKSIDGKYIYEGDVLSLTKSHTQQGETIFYYADKLGEIKLPKERNPLNYYRSASPYSCGLALIEDVNYERKYIDMHGDVIIDASEYDMCWGFEESVWGGNNGFKNLAFVSKNGTDPWDSDTKFGMINTKGKVVLPIEYEHVFLCSKDVPGDQNVGWVKKDGLYGAINKKTKLITPIKYSEVTQFDEGSALVKWNGCWGLIDSKGKTIFPFTITEVGQSNFNALNRSPRYLVKQDNYWGIVNEKGKTIVSFNYTGWEEYPSTDTIRLYKKNGDFITWNIKKDINLE